jgi:U3 small nucleolar RNA-associated protein 7
MHGTSANLSRRFLHDQSHFAVAQKKYVFIYDKDGVELHRLKSHIEPTRLEFLPYHWLLASVVRPSFLPFPPSD